ncbi:MAG: tRNA (adenosine(37)-N6)-threonylcarbamoyltransferase complex ATPase subunit type 1 TsaE [Candidatus Raymondbacteria bacterium RifOxyC12_full_50_8]|uniref:tRNA threonylcarbamoyladenosine biosynthesis protein TsaE n=1 Tax=Candidatus Raymondbacteria bacterium RIFOXYD12_FULL_49_13 TaxID=1817890 RepID=A0A1F7FFH0_UNCRA|nr:MAG: tRNA (adenosine(37)-N6)-threonylcarbamoyltransferase complex ATPase subunit type 1 TsaE [Candidatus Raymondbacteria bacterium RIFOXYA2_FULL_49_16]OGK01041.1 MAG: tRNA (adenosine(37)-N6)-threonylcarbamoyltransferase complex ATPase subunit type 1 TsaE [Candidatus Raymondbacteria bacterium RifOxyB12_full_50_8]OGK03391.1 MAG: tRNA (adenosine(37)-N6)-threonylcarbamoyltransferase complex ATPase subunit type 1 TsaE [Candidatus Raymondbacteria bacterium RifOxyC12_full_50_8]OGK05341.1 MAG: tRNA (
MNQTGTTVRIVSASPRETEEAGFAFAGQLGPRAVVGLYGDLGSGKTCFVQGAARALRVEGQVNSPTYALVQVYQGKRTVIHMDAYRLKTPDEMLHIGFEDYLAEEAICFIEWADRIQPLMPADALAVRFKAIDATTREITY